MLGSHNYHKNPVWLFKEFCLITAKAFFNLSSMFTRRNRKNIVGKYDFVHIDLDHKICVFMTTMKRELEHG